MTMQPVNQSYPSGEIAYASIEQKVLNDILPKIKTMSAPGKKTQNDMAFVKKIVLPMFVEFYKKWPAGYNMLIKSDLTVKITKYKAEEFSARKYAPNAPADKRIESLYTFYPGNKTVINLNGYDSFRPWQMKESLFHEIMHAANNALVKDEPGCVTLMSNLLDYPDGFLTALQACYMERLQKAGDQIGAIVGNKKMSAEQFNKIYEKVIDRNNCWVCEKYNPKNGETIEQFLEHCFAIPFDANEFLAYGLQAYFGGDRARLQKQEPELYKLIVDKVLPRIKNMSAPFDKLRTSPKKKA